jgi:putative SOS response-associated peptidase YedK
MPEELFEAARMDGASELQNVRLIACPWPWAAIAMPTRFSSAAAIIAAVSSPTSPLAVKRKAPHHIRLRGGEPFGFAGIYTPPTEEAPGTYAIVTTTPNELTAPIHDRMPVILAPEWEALWLDPSTTDPERVLPLLQPFPAERMEAYRVDYDVGTSANDRPDLVAPLA